MRSVGKWAVMLAAVLVINLGIPMRAGAAKLVAITFDDGPNKTWTPKVVEALDQRGVKGTFFMVGGWVATKEDLVQQMVRTGHQIANHTWEHLDLRDLSREDVASQVEKSREKLSEVTGQENFLVRTPFGVRTAFCGGGFFRVFPYWYIRREIRRLNAQGQPAVVYLHPRDIDAEQPRLKLEPVNGFLYHYGLTAAAGKWRRLMSEFTWMPFGGWLEDAAA